MILSPDLNHVNLHDRLVVNSNVGVDAAADEIITIGAALQQIGEDSRFHRHIVGQKSNGRLRSIPSMKMHHRSINKFQS